MTPEEEALALEREILLREIGEVGARGGRLGGALGAGAAGAGGGGSGGRSGARWSAKRLREDRCELELTANVPAQQALQTAAEVLAAAGTLVEEPLPALEHPEVWAVVGVGVRNLNPAVTRVAVVPIDDAHCRVVVRAAAKEGLIKQRGGQKAAELVRERLDEALAHPL